MRRLLTVTGYFNGEFVLGDSTLTATTSPAAFVVRWDPQGDVTLAIAFADASTEPIPNPATSIGLDLALLPGGGYALAGQIHPQSPTGGAFGARVGDQEILFSEATVTGGFIAILDAAGRLVRHAPAEVTELGALPGGDPIFINVMMNERYLHRLTPAGTVEMFNPAQTVSTFAVDGGGRVLAVLQCESEEPISLGAGATADCSGEAQSHLAAFDPAGKPLFVKAIPVSGQLTAGPAGEAIVFGSFSGPVDFGGGLLQSADEDGFVAIFDAQGQHSRSLRFGAAGRDACSGFWPLGSNEGLLLGLFSGTLDLGDGPVTSTPVSAENPSAYPDVILARIPFQ